MELRAWIMQNMELIFGLLIAVVTLLQLRQRERLRQAEARAKKLESEADKMRTDSQRELEAMRADASERKAMLDLLKGQLLAVERNSDAQRENNDALRSLSESIAQQVQQNASIMKTVNDNSASALNAFKDVSGMIASFQTFSSGQHTQTRAAIAEVGKQIKDELSDAVSEIKEARKQMQNYANDPAHQQVNEKLERVETKLDTALASLQMQPGAQPAEGEEKAA